MIQISSNRWAAPLLAALLVALVHGASLAFWFHSDDFFIMLDVRDHGPFGVWSGRQAAYFRPLTSLSHWADVSVYGTHALGHHLTNLLLAMLGAALVVLLARRLAPAAPSWLPTLAGALFALMPAHAEAVDWVSCRGDLLSTDFALGAIIAALRGGKAVWAAAGLTALAIACKESALGVPLYLGAMALLSKDKKLRPAVIATFGVAVSMVALRALIIGELVGGTKTTPSLVRAAANAPLFLMSALSPASVQTLRSSPIRSLAPILDSMLIHHVLVAGLLAVGALVLLFTRLRMDSDANRVLWATLAGFFALALPTLIQGGLYGFTWEGTRYVYLPSASLAIFLALAIARLPQKGALTVGITLAVVYALGDVPAVGAWRVAGEYARQVTTALLAERGRVVALAIPDNYRGAFVFRNGMNEALQIFGPECRLDILVLASYATESPGDWPRTIPNGVVAVPGAIPFKTFDPGPLAGKFSLSDLSLSSKEVCARTGTQVSRVIVYPDRVQDVP